MYNICYIKLMKYMALFFIVSLFSCLSRAEFEVKEFHLCSNKNYVRTVRIEIKQDKTCQTLYSKAGVDQLIGSGMYIESCQKFLQNVIENLQSAGWTCRQVESVNMSTNS